jgi:hypothetical protein
VQIFLQAGSIVVRQTLSTKCGVFCCFCNDDILLAAEFTILIGVLAGAETKPRFGSEADVLLMQGTAGSQYDGTRLNPGLGLGLILLFIESNFEHLVSPCQSISDALHLGESAQRTNI